MRGQLFFALFTTWAIVWAFVAYCFSGATYKSWREQGGLFRAIPKEAGGFLRWFFLNVYQDARHGFRPYDEAIPERYTNGHLLRLFITMSAFVASLLGLLGSLIDRSQWPMWMVTMVVGAVILSIIAGLGHLTVAWVRKPRKWRWLVFFLCAWFPFAFLVRGVL